MFFRFAIFVGLGSVVATIIYLTPVPARYEFRRMTSPACYLELTKQVDEMISSSIQEYGLPITYKPRRVSLATYAIRTFVVLGMIISAATFLHLCNYRPKQTFLSCDRPCHHLDWPMICRVKLTLEVFQSLSKSCGSCLANETACLAKHCVSADGLSRGILTANRQLPGPSIQVCENDILVVDVVNRLPGKTAAVHWRGQSQIETPYMDGVPLVTQCPIPSYTTFQYKFRAAAPGTHLWHAHSSSDVTNGIFGSLIVRQADLREPHRSLYDIDDPDHVILVSPWHHTIVSEGSSNEVRKNPAVLLVNGRGRQQNGPKTPLATFTVLPGRRHRFRVAHGGGAGSCPITLSVENHPLVLIALDGHPVSPQEVTSITLAKGERADFILKAIKPISSYLMSFRTSNSCSGNPTSGWAILKYEGNSESEIIADEKLSGKVEIAGMLANQLHVSTDPIENCAAPGNVCITEVKASKPLTAPLNNTRMDVTIYLPINQRTQAADFMGNGDVETRVLSINNATFTYPSSPLLTQGVDIAENVLCPRNLLDGEEGSTSRCRGSGSAGNSDSTAPCECVHVRKIPLGSTVEIVLIDQAGLDDLVYHLHGYSFHVVAARKFGRSRSLREVKAMDERGVLFDRKLSCPPMKDTVIVPKFGAVALRFKANNPGFWLLRDEHALEWTRGLDVILQVGEAGDMIAAPQDFPKCGSFVGPDYFLI